VLITALFGVLTASANGLAKLVGIAATVRPTGDNG
jgi:hypothetical protein